MKQLVLLFCMFAPVATFAENIENFNLTCVSPNGVTLNVPSSNGFFMQNIGLSNDYDNSFLKDLIKRHVSEGFEDKGVALMVHIGSCDKKETGEINCNADTFGDASYLYFLDQDTVTVRTAVNGHIDLSVTADAKGILQLNVKLTNTENNEQRELVVSEIFGQLTDPAKSSLTAWSPGCQLIKREF